MSWKSGMGNKKRSYRILKNMRTSWCL